MCIVLKIQDIHKSFANRKILNGISLSLVKGDIYTLMGPNGSGKTTLFNIITGFLKQDEGTIEFNDIRLNNNPPAEINRLGT